MSRAPNYGEKRALALLLDGARHEMHVCDRPLAIELEKAGWITITMGLAEVVPAGAMLEITDAGRAQLR